jgi:orotate phosphoribosyltransferase, Thermus family
MSKPESGKGDIMEFEQVIREFREAGALLEGHFILSSGLHSDRYLQCARVLMHPERAARLCAALAQKIADEPKIGEIDLVVSPAMGGVVVGYEMARQLNVPGMFTERVDGDFVFRRGFELTRGQKVLMVEDVVTTGKSSRECIDVITQQGGDVVGACSLVDRSNGKVDLGVAYVSLIGMDVPSYDPANLPEHLRDIPAVKPGSRHLSR